MNTFSTAEIAKILKVRPSWIRAQAHRTLISPIRDTRGHYRYSFQDILLLRATRSLSGPDISPRRVQQTLHELSQSLPAETNLSSLKLKREGHRILAGDASNTWDPHTGQTILPFESTRTDVVTQLDLPSRANRNSTISADDWFDLALSHEHSNDLKSAERAYITACRLDSNHVNARINLGRLRHGANALEEAECYYREALHIKPRHSIALFNLGVVLEDRENFGSAIQCYKLAIDADPQIAEAHYNLARLYVKQSEDTEAIRHYSRYKALIRKKE